VKEGYIGKFSMNDPRGGWGMTAEERKAARSRINFKELILSNLESRKIALGLVLEDGKIQDVGPTPPGDSPRVAGEFISIDTLVNRLKARQMSFSSMNVAVNKDWNFFICWTGHVYPITRMPGDVCRECGLAWRWRVREGILWNPAGDKIVRSLKY